MLLALLASGCFALLAVALALVAANARPGPSGGGGVPGVPGPAPANGFPGRFFGPFMDTSMGGSRWRNCPCSVVSLGFMLAGGDGRPAWNGNQPLDAMKSLVAGMRAAGKEPICSFGGESGSELGSVIKDANALARAYLAVIDAYGFKWADFDIEGAAYQDTEACHRRNQALAIVQRQRPGVTISYTFPSETTGLPAACVATLQHAKSVGLRVDVCNLMTMFFGGSQPNMGQTCIRAAAAAHGQCGLPMGICPNIGVNSGPGDVFQLRDAQAVLEFARRTPWVRWLTFWSVDRDRAGPGGGTSAQNNASGVAQGDYAFSKVFAQFR